MAAQAKLAAAAAGSGWTVRVTQRDYDRNSSEEQNRIGDNFYIILWEKNKTREVVWEESKMSSLRCPLASQLVVPVE